MCGPSQRVFDSKCPPSSFTAIGFDVGVIGAGINALQLQPVSDNLAITGGGAVNDAVMHISNSHLPFGGVGSSGIGNYHAEAGFKVFSHYKSILQKPFWLEPNLKYPPYSSTKLNWIKKLLA